MYIHISLRQIVQIVVEVTPLKTRGIAKYIRDLSATYDSLKVIAPASGWHRYKLARCEANIPENQTRWYVKHVETFLE